MRLVDTTMYQNGTYPFFVFAYSIIILLNASSILYYFFNLYITFRVKHYKTNMHRIHQFIYATCPFTSVFLTADAAINIMGRREIEFPLPLVLLRTFMSCPPLFAVVAIMLERLCATYFVSDYEGNQRPYIGYMIILFLIAISLTTTYIFTFPHLVALFVTLHLSLIAICYVVSLITYKLNKKYYNRNRVHRHSYSLGERYQISENIRLYKFFSNYLFVLAIFPLICTVLALIDHLDPTAMHREVYSVLFDLSYTLLCFFAPYLTYKMSEPWQAELDVIFVKLGIKKPNKIHALRESQKTLRGTFGEEMNVETSKHTGVYFTQLKSSWNTENGRVV